MYPLNILWMEEILHQLIWFIPVSIGFKPSKVLQDFFHPPYQSSGLGEVHGHLPTIQQALGQLVDGGGVHHGVVGITWGKCGRNGWNNPGKTGQNAGKTWGNGFKKPWGDTVPSEAPNSLRW